ncbi:MAG: serine/threonine-protein kinase [Sandaracinaceae bacterium]
MRRDKPGKLIAGRYELLEPAGEGGMAVVWRALTRGAGSFARPVAVKRIHAAKGADQHFVRLFEEEARVGADMHHPNIVQIIDFGVDDTGDYYLVMEWIDGLDFHQWVRSYPRGFDLTPWPLVTAIGVEVLRGLAAAHERVTAEGVESPVFHRDVSPSNVLIGTNGSVKLTDFGLARAMDRASMTRPNVIKGKLAYCAPELVTGAKSSAQSDIFAVGVVLWEALAQQRLFTGKNDLEVLLAVRKGDITPLSDLRHDLPAPLWLAIRQSLEPDPAARFESARAMSRALAAILHSHPEPIDAEPIGKSVVQARQRLGMVDQPPRGRAGQSDSVHDLSISDVSFSDLNVPDPSLEIDVTVEGKGPPPTPSTPSRSNPVRGLWSGAESGPRKDPGPDSDG